MQLGQAAHNQALFRAVNERVGVLQRGFVTSGEESSWICECVKAGCTVRIALTIAEYDLIRARPSRFAVAPGDEHVAHEAEDVVERTARYWIVQRVD